MAGLSALLMKILVMGGTRFVGKPLVARLQDQGHALTLFTRGRLPSPEGVESIQGDRSVCLLYTSPSPRDVEESRMPSSA